MNEKDRLRELENQIAQALNKISKQQSLMQLVPRYSVGDTFVIPFWQWQWSYDRFSISDYSNAKEDYLMKEGELEKSRSTLEGVAVEYQRLQNNLQKVISDIYRIQNHWWI